jgi:exodeoxyribonuclease VII small subunit
MKTPTFSEMTKRIEEIASVLEKGDVSLEDSLKLFEEASGLIAKCNKALNNAKMKINDISTLDDGDKNE